MLATLVALCGWVGAAGAVAPTPAEMTLARQWRDAHFTADGAAWPFSFRLGGQDGRALLRDWKRDQATDALDPHRTRTTVTWTDPAGTLQVRCSRVEYDDFPALEWTVFVRNIGTARTPVVSELLGLDTTLERSDGGEFLLHHWKGDTFAPDLYEPQVQELGPGATAAFAPVGGRGSNGAFPYYDLQQPGGGLLLAVGWPGQWSSRFAREGERGLKAAAGQELLHTALEPGEEIRSPLIALVFWAGSDTERAQNLWRRWMWRYNVPRDSAGQVPRSLLFGNTSLEFNEMTGADEANQYHFIDRYVEERVPIDFWWMDAGWYPCDGQWPKTGTWEPDPKRFPRGLRAISDHAATRSIRTLVWFEPERVAGGTWISDNHPEWLRGGTLLDLGRRDAREWLTNHVDRTLREQGIALYRQDFNMDPLPFWRKDEPADRQGLAENLHVQGYLAYWDELRKRQPDLIIDSCASGGRRNDLETMRRAIALHPTDYNYADLPVKQAFHSSLFQWLPSFGSNTIPIDSVDPYAFRSGHARNVVLGYDLRRSDLDYEGLRRLAAEWRRTAEFYTGDYYPLTPYNRAEDRWLAWQFHDAEQDTGVIEAFRRTGCAEDVLTVTLRGLDPQATYEVSDGGTPSPRRATGRELAETGLPVAITARPGAAVLFYRMAGRN